MTAHRNEATVREGPKAPQVSSDRMWTKLSAGPIQGVDAATDSPTQKPNEECRMRVPIKITVMAIAVVLAATACSSSKKSSSASTGASGGSSSSESASNSSGATNIKVTTFGCDIFNVYAHQTGIYAKHGLNVTDIKTTGGSANVAAIMSGAADFGYVNGYSAIIAASQGFPIQFVVGAAVNAVPPAPPAQGLFVPKDSPIKSAADFKGKKIAVNEINGVNMIVTEQWLIANGVDPTDVQFVALPFSDQIPAALSGKVAAAQEGWTFVGTNGDKIRSVADPYVAAGNVLLGTYVATKSLIAKGDTAKKFHDAMAESVTALKDPANTDKAFGYMSDCQKVPAATLKAQPQNGLDPAITPASVDALSAQLVKLKLISKAPDAASLIAPIAQ